MELQNIYESDPISLLVNETDFTCTFTFKINYCFDFKFAIISWNFSNEIIQYGHQYFDSLTRNDYLIIKNIDDFKCCQLKIGDWQKMITKKLQKTFLKSKYFNYKQKIKSKFLL